MNVELKDFFEKMPKRSLPTLNETILRWSGYVIKMIEWEKIGIDDYLLFLYARQRIANILQEEKMTDEFKHILEEADKKFINITIETITIETEKSFIRSIKTQNNNRQENWFAYRVLKIHYNDWIRYALF